ncbi:MAG TPA: lysophospholipid acyltransferase family protein [Actinomycetota bacterium]|nr:lysophospholipid acyltransferase family protein [Actinomycetota bacterium]
MLQPPFDLWFNWRFEGLERVPAEGPAILAGNHLSYLDPFAHAFFVVKAGRRPRFLAKQELFDHRLIGVALRGARQIPVSRGTGDRSALDDAAAALEAGEVVVIYPEGTTTTNNPDFSPGRGKTGAVRLSLRTGVPILPVATWGGQYVWRSSGRQNLSFGRPVWVRAGDPFDPSARAVDREDPAAVRALTDELMHELARLVDGLRARYPTRWAASRRPERRQRPTG